MKSCILGTTLLLNSRDNFIFYVWWGNVKVGEQVGGVVASTQKAYKQLLAMHTCTAC